MDKIIRVAHFPGALSGGVGSVIFNLFKNIDRSKVQFDFYVSYGENITLEREIEQLGGRIFHIPQIREVGIVNYYKEIVRILKKEPQYNVVHIHSIHIGAVVALASKFAGIKEIIYHVHNTQDPILNTPLKKNLLGPALRALIKVAVDKKVACGYDAGKYIYGNSTFTIINNGIDLERFSVHAVNNSYKTSPSDIIVGNVGRVTDVKNQSFILDLAKLDKEKNNRCKFLIIGNGPLLDELRSKVVDLGLSDKVIFLGARNDLEVLYNSMDVFILPSKHEGFPVSLVEAQACGLPCITSDNVTEKADLNVAGYKRLHLNPELWIGMIYEFAKKKERDTNAVRSILSQAGFDIRDNAKELLDLYFNR